jgi:hypothetical protein
MKADAWDRLIQRLISETAAGRIVWSPAGPGGGAVASTRRGSFVVRYIGGLGVTARPSLEVRDAEGQVLDRLESENPLVRFNSAITGGRPVLPGPSTAELEALVARLDSLITAIAESSDRIEATAFEILGGL